MRECPKCGTCYPDQTSVCQFHEVETKQVLPGAQKLAGRYLLERRLGRGAMGQVYLARDENLGTRQVAVKTVRPELLTSEDLQEGEAIARFEREARAAASIRHPNVVDVTDFGKTADGVFFLVMEYVKGETLHDLLRREGTLTANRACVLLTQIAHGVEAAHEAGILHRDLKPANIFLLKTGKNTDKFQGDGFIKVGDFGLAKIVGDAQNEISAKQGPASRGIIGTPEFMAPEQMHSENQVDQRADIYALGAIAYLMLGGRVPFVGDLMQIISQKLNAAPPPLSRFRSDVAPEVEHAIMHALENDPNKRPASSGDWIVELTSAVERTANPKDQTGAGRVVILAPVGAEVYVDDERKGSVGSSGRIVLNSVQPGRHVLRVAGRGLRDDERLIEIREDSAEQVIQAALKPAHDSLGRVAGDSSGASSQRRDHVPDVVVCLNCQARYAAGVKFCGRCGKNQFRLLNAPNNGGSQSNQTSTNNLSVSTPPNRFTINTGQVPSQPLQSPQSQNQQINCPRCSKLLPANAKFCGNCGLHLTAGLPSQQQPVSGSLFQNAQPRAVEVVCQKCGTVYRAGTRFCGKCGSQIVS